MFTLQKGVLATALILIPKILWFNILVLTGIVMLFDTEVTSFNTVSKAECKMLRWGS